MEPNISLRCSQDPATELFWVSWIQSLVLFCDVKVGLASRLLLADFPIKMLYAFLTYPMRARWPTRLMLHLLP
jgi:hypothetical protein